MLTLSDAIPILIVEDNEIDIIDATQVLIKNSIQNTVHIAHDANEALASLSEPPLLGVDNLIILLDIGMPGIDGALLLDFLVETPTYKNYQIIILSGSENPQHIDLVKSHNLAGYLKKPFQFDKFCAIIEAYN
ncbi:MAG: response regulator [Planctomycetes bacterium]|nr:response regulator [Planctomycetota bacterium]